MNRNKIVALLPLKKNSERIPMKNFKILAGKPLFFWMLETLLQVEDIDLIVINTDAEDELRVAGLKPNPRILVRPRNQKICGDLVSMNKVISDDIKAVPAQFYLMTHVTNPLVSKETVKGAVDEFLNAKKQDSLFSVNRIQTRFYHKDGSPVNHNPKDLCRTQDLAPWFEENSCLYIFTEAGFEISKSRIGLTPIMYETPKNESVDIDNPEDWALAESLMEYKKKNG